METDHDDLLWRSTAVEQVQALRRDVLPKQSVKSVPLDSVTGRVVANSITANRDIPAHSHATMDGFAIDATDDYPLSVRTGEVYPEDEPPSLESGEAIRIATGAPLPAAANAVLKREAASVTDGRLRGPDLEPGTYAYERGSNVTAGETLYHRFDRLTPNDAILLGDLGLDSVPVYEPFEASILATGTEIHEGRSRDLDSNMLAGQIRAWGHEAVIDGTVPDEYDRVRSTLDRLAETADVIVTTGGTSVGEKDYVVRALAELGSLCFHRVRVRPGKPIAAARLPEHDAVAFAIPGKPIGAHLISSLVMRPFFTADRLPTIDVTIQYDVPLETEGFEYAVPVTVESDERTTAVPLGHVESPLRVYDDAFDPSVLSSSTRASQADGIVLTETSLEAGQPVSVVPFSTLA